MTCVEDEDEDYDDYEDEEGFEDFVFPSVMPRILRAWNKKMRTGPLHSYHENYKGHEKK